MSLLFFFSPISTIPYAISDTSAILVAFDGVEDRIYLHGGCIGDIPCTVNVTSDARICTCNQVSDMCSYFLPVSNVWHNCTAAPRKRYRHTAVQLSSKIYLIGGKSTNGTVVREIDVYDIVSNTWLQSTPYYWNSATSDLAAFGITASENTYLSGDIIYLFGGFREDGSISKDISSVSIASTQITKLSGLSLLSPRAQMASTVVNNKFYIFGGWNQTLEYQIASKSCPKPVQLVEWFDPKTLTLNIDNALPYGTSSAISSVIGLSTFVIGGLAMDSYDNTCTHFGNTYNVYRKDVGDLFWSFQGTCPSSFARNAAVTSAKQSRIFLFGGLSIFDVRCNCYRAHDKVYVFAPSYTSPTPFQLSPAGIAGVVIAGFVVLACCGCLVFTALTRKVVKKLNTFDAVSPL